MEGVISRASAVERLRCLPAKLKSFPGCRAFEKSPPAIRQSGECLRKRRPSPMSPLHLKIFLPNRRGEISGRLQFPAPAAPGMVDAADRQKTQATNAGPRKMLH